MKLSAIYQIFLDCQSVTTDSRNCPDGSLFIALKGESFNGNAFAGKALEDGCAFAIIDEAQYAIEGDRRYILVNDCLQTLQQLANYHRRQLGTRVIGITGTNGKTTTNNMLCAALEREGQKVVCNHTGSNMLNGVVAAFVLAAGPTGRLDADYACIEGDEASTRHVFPGLKPDYKLLTNLFRDQLDRYGEIDITMNILEEMIRTVPKMQVIVNVDDALSAYLAMDSGNPYIT